MLLLVLEKDEGTDRKRDKNINWLPPLGTPRGDGTQTWVCVLNGN